MSYRCGIGPGVGLPPQDPTIYCDGKDYGKDCGARRVITGRPPAWFLDGKPVPGWRMVRHPNGTRTDLCPECRAPQEARKP